ncbi:unnamed protein product [Rotaria sp. Silwood2]|nr:unnamed protein product [Rotaria sp. Silwood2]CAF2646280.1 unnamed protein product [Rotaria sp. Silwood2]CAF2864404.1 unnamed protein product [Rotaria sp. Silwood2]CAF3038671.1 unnamed protein product [Rotaria sp. Silwood2]CAF4123085.1 unnamed protein product [Rotaria sp. Silwood2]
MSSTNDTYHHLFVQTQPKSILKKSPSPRFLDSSNDFEKNYYSNINLSSTYETDKNDIDQSVINNNNNHNKCMLNDNQYVTDNIKSSSIETPLTTSTMKLNENLSQYKIDNQLIGSIPPADAISSSPHTSDDEQQQQRIKIKSKKNYYRPFVINGTVSSSASSSSDNDNDERKAKRSMRESKTTLIHSNKYRQKDMQLDEFMRKYQQHGGIYMPIIKESFSKEQITSKDLINDYENNNHHFPLTKQQNSYVDKRLINDDTLSLLESIDRITLSTESFSPLQLLYDVARRNQYDRRTKIDHVRQYVEEQIGITAFLTIYKLLKSSQIPIDIQQKPFCYYANFIPHLCCLIMLESEQQKNRV